MSPNLQNIPVNTELGRQIKQAAFEGESKKMLVLTDYCGISKDLRVAIKPAKEKRNGP